MNKVIVYVTDHYQLLLPLVSKTNINTPKGEVGTIGYY
jgi:hypothetical protein